MDETRTAPDRAGVPNPAEIRALVGRIFGSVSEPGVERVTEGVSTYVYRVRRGERTFYLRVLPEVGARFTPEARAHDLVRQRGVRAPEVVYVDDRDEHLGLAVMVTTEIPGEHVGSHPVDDLTRRVMIDAGRQLALVNGVPVDGFGWIRRDASAGDGLAGEHSTFELFVREHLEDDLAVLAGHAFGRDELAAIRAVIDDRADWLNAERAHLAHGDFDATQIFQQRGRYTGIIDFGEIRGADAWYDLGHFCMHDGETLSGPALGGLLEGYQTVTPLPPDHSERIAFASLLIAIRALARRLARNPRGVGGHIGLATVRRDVALLRA